MTQLTILERPHELRNVARDLLIVRATTVHAGDGSLFDPASEASKVLSDGAMSCLRSADQLEGLLREKKRSSIRNALQNAVPTIMTGIAAFLLGAIIFSDRTRSPELVRAELRWMAAHEDGLSRTAVAIDGSGDAGASGGQDGNR